MKQYKIRIQEIYNEALRLLETGDMPKEAVLSFLLHELHVRGELQ